MGTPGSSPRTPGLPCTAKLQSDFWHLLQTVSRCNCFILFGGAEYDLVSSTVHTGGQVWLLEHNGAWMDVAPGPGAAPGAQQDPICTVLSPVLCASPPKLSRRDAAVSSREILKNSQQWLQGHVRAEGCLEQHCGTLGSVLMATEWCWHCLFDHFQAVVMGTEIKSAQRFSPCHSEQRPMGH